MTDTPTPKPITDWAQEARQQYNAGLAILIELAKGIANADLTKDELDEAILTANLAHVSFQASHAASAIAGLGAPLAPGQHPTCIDVTGGDDLARGRRAFAAGMGCPDSHDLVYVPMIGQTRDEQPRTNRAPYQGPPLAYGECATCHGMIGAYQWTRGPMQENGPAGPVEYIDWAHISRRSGVTLAHNHPDLDHEPNPAGGSVRRRPGA